MMCRTRRTRFILLRAIAVLISATLFQFMTTGIRAESPLREASTNRASGGRGFWQRLRTPSPTPVIEGRSLGQVVAQRNVHRVFRAFYLSRTAPLGTPVSEALYERGHLVQYFEHARLAWYPEHLADRRVVCHMGVRMPGVTPTVFGGGPTPVPTVVSSELGPVPMLQVTCAYPQPGRGGWQVVTATLVAPDGRPVADVPVKITAYQQGGTVVLGPELTGPRGEVTQQFAIGASPSGTTVYVDAEFLWGQSVVRARTSYMVWY